MVAEAAGGGKALCGMAGFPSVRVCLRHWSYLAMED